MKYRKKLEKREKTKKLKQMVKRNTKGIVVKKINIRTEKKIQQHLIHHRMSRHPK